jgi:hypothetical protein
MMNVDAGWNLNFPNPSPPSDFFYARRFPQLDPLPNLFIATATDKSFAPRWWRGHL